MSQNARWARRLAALIIVPMAALVTTGVPAYASSAVHPASTSGFESYQNLGSGLTSANDCLYHANGNVAAVGKPAGGISCTATEDANFVWHWFNNGGIWQFEIENETGYCLAVNGAHNGYLEKCDANDQVNWEVKYTNSGHTEFQFYNQEYGLCLGVGSSSHVVEARTCSSSSYQVWKD